MVLQSFETPLSLYFFLFIFFTANSFPATHSHSRRFHEFAESLYLSLSTQHYLGAPGSAHAAQCKLPHGSSPERPVWHFPWGARVSCMFRLQGNVVESPLLFTELFKEVQFNFKLKTYAGSYNNILKIITNICKCFIAFKKESTLQIFISSTWPSHETGIPSHRFTKEDAETSAGLKVQGQRASM